MFFGPGIRMGSPDCTVYTPVLEHTLLDSTLLRGKYSAFLQLLESIITTELFIDQTDTHYC